MYRLFMGGLRQEEESDYESEEEEDEEHEYEIRSQGCPPILVFLLLLCFFGWGLALGPYFLAQNASPPSDLPRETTIHHRSETWAGALQRRDAALEDVMTNFWTQTLSPELIVVAAQQR